MRRGWGCDSMPHHLPKQGGSVLQPGSLMARVCAIDSLLTVPISLQVIAMIKRDFQDFTEQSLRCLGHHN